MSDKILIVDDDLSLLELAQYNLEAEGYKVVTAKDGVEGIRMIHTEHPDLLILDVMMPKLDGYQVCEHVRETSDLPVIMLTARGQEEDIIKGLDLGADDYLTKPFRVGELLARVRATLRRARTESFLPKGVIYSDDYLSVDLTARRVVVNGELVKLTPIEYELLSVLIRNKGRVVEFRQLLKSVWGLEYTDQLEYLRVYIWHLRRKIELDPKAPCYLLNELGIGYRFEPQ